MISRLFIKITYGIERTICHLTNKLFLNTLNVKTSDSQIKNKIHTQFILCIIPDK